MIESLESKVEPGKRLFTSYCACQDGSTFVEGQMDECLLSSTEQNEVLYAGVASTCSSTVKFCFGRLRVIRLESLVIGSCI